MAEDMQISTDAVLAGVRRSYSTRLDQLIYENALLSAAVDELQRKIAELTGG